MTVEACKAGKDVYVEKPRAPSSKKEADGPGGAQYNRVVQLGTMQRSGVHFQKATEVVRKAISARCLLPHWNVGNASPQRFGNPPDSRRRLTSTGICGKVGTGASVQCNRFGVCQMVLHLPPFWD